MSKLNEGLYSSESHAWMTPPDFIDALLAFEGRRVFDLDPCCTEKNIPAVVHYIDGQHDGLSEPWMQDHNASSLIFLNPPYGNALKWWMEKCCKEVSRGCRIWALIPARTETAYQHNFGMTKAGFTVFLKGRLCFLKDGLAAGSAPFPTMLLYYGDDWKDKARRWNEKPPLAGTLMTRGVI